jgi:hypothetical protein
MNSTYLKFGAATLLFALWTALVWTNHADPGLIDAIKYALGTLGIYHAVENLGTWPPSSSSASPPAPTAEALAQAIAAVLAQQPPPNVVVNVPSKPTPKEPQ